MKSAKTCTPNSTLNEAARIMWDANCGAVPVVDDAGTLLGMVTDRDVCMAAYTRGQALSSINVESAMSRQLATTSPKASVLSVMQLMRARQIRRVPVVGDSARFVGIIALADIALHLEQQGSLSPNAAAELARTLADVSKPAAPGN
jgi:CBS domain-containing protein